MTIPRLSPDVEKPFRDALGHAIRNEIDKMEQGLLRLTDEQIVGCLSLCAAVAGYVAIDACGRQWPIDKNLRGMAERTTKSDNAQAFGLKAEDSYAYMKRVALGGEMVNAVLSPIEDAGTLSFVITGFLLVAFRATAEEHWWQYLDRIEEAWEAALVTDLDLLPALMLRARRPTSPAGPESPSGATGAGSS